MNAVRSVFTLLMLILLAVSVAGWIWAGGQPSPKLEGARFILAVCGVAAIGGTVLLWTSKTPQLS